MSLPLPQHLAFIGGGNMARSLVGGLLARSKVDPLRIAVAEPCDAARERMAADFGVRVCADNVDAVANADAVVLAVKPQVMRAVCEDLATVLPADALVVSVAAGIRTAQISQWLGGERPVVRVMPNTPALVGAGAAGLFGNAAVSDLQRGQARALLEATGRAEWIADEALMDAVTAVSGSGPAYFFLLVEAMEEAGVAEGLPRGTARALVLQTCVGAARMLEAGDTPAAELRRRVTSPGGTTQAAIEAFEAGGFRDLVRQAIAAATQRGKALSGGN